MKKTIVILTIFLSFYCSKNPIENEKLLAIYEMDNVIAWYYTDDKDTIPYVIGAILEGEALGTIEEYKNYVIVKGVYLYSSGYFVFSGKIDTLIYIVENSENDTLRDIDGIIWEKNKIIIRAEEELNLKAMHPRSIYIYANIKKED